jgi:regulator of protease activity HflC (stomatin/prohibitin superfamily)
MSSEKKIMSLVAVIIFVIIVSMSFFIVPAGKKAVVYKFGEIVREADAGFHWNIPLVEKVEKITLQPIEEKYRIDVGEDGAITKDNQTIGADTVVYYRYSPDQISHMMNEYGKQNIKSIVISSTKESFKEIVGRYDIFALAESQEEIRVKVLESLRVKFSSYPVILSDLKINNYNWSEEFDNQIEETMKRAQQVRQAEQDLQITEKNAQKKVKEAEADKEAAKLLAEAKALEGDGIKKYNEAVQVNWDIELKKLELEIEKLRVQKWDGAYVSQNNYGPIPFQGGSILGATK